MHQKVCSNRLIKVCWNRYVPHSKTTLNDNARSEKKNKQAAKNLLEIANGSSSSYKVPLNEYHVYGFQTCPWYQKALKAYQEVADVLGWKIVAKGHATRAKYKAWLASDDTKKILGALGDRASKHTSSPLVITGSKSGDNHFVGGHDDSVKHIAASKAVEKPKAQPSIKVDKSRLAQIAQAVPSADDDEACAT